jgi:serine/threonine protein phosphatase 1
MEFDPERDRVLSVGDLIDRGPESLDTLALIEEPWFHAVLGNHEMMLLNYLGYYGSRVHSRKSFPSGSGSWVNEAASRHRKKLSRLADRLASLPLAINVDGPIPFNVTHGDLHPLGDSQRSLLDEPGVCVHVADSATSSRRNIGEAMKSGFVDLDFADQPVQVSDAPFGELPLTYVGHSPLARVTVHRSYVYIDQRVAARSVRRSEDRPPTVLDQTRFAFWLRGVALAREGVGARERAMFPLRTDPPVRSLAAVRA